MSYTDLVIQDLVVRQQELLERIASLESEREGYRKVLAAALEALHSTTKTLNRSREAFRRLLELERGTSRGAETARVIPGKETRFPKSYSSAGARENCVQ